MNGMDALGWALVHFVWQGAALAVVLGVLLSLTRVTAARARYGMALATLGAMFIAPAVTAFQLYQAPGRAPAPPVAEQTQIVADQPPSASPSSSLRGSSSKAFPAPAPATPAVTSPSRFVSARALLVPALPWLVGLWAAGVVVLSVRLARGWTTARRLRTDGTRPSSPALLAMLDRLAARLRVSRPVQLVESAIVEVPAVIGWLKPVILVPASALTGLTPQQIEVLLAHELAHVRRHDYLVNLVQSVIETLLFYHPAVWWVSRRVREEREHCCDDVAVAVCGDALTYARALLEMEQLRAATPQLAVAANGGVLMNRIQRLVGVQAPPTNRFTGLVAGLIVLTTVVCLGVGAQILLPSANSDNTDQPLVSVRKINPAVETTSVTSRAEMGQSA